MLFFVYLIIFFGCGSFFVSFVNLIFLVLRLNAKEIKRKERVKREILSLYVLVVILVVMWVDILWMEEKDGYIIFFL